MPAYNFKMQFREPILSGRKRHTIRAHRRRSTKPGERIVLYTGMRTKLCSKIAESVCTKVQEIIISPDWKVSIDGEALDVGECNRLAWADGFATFMVMMEFWQGRLPFHGEIIHWRPLDGR